MLLGVFRRGEKNPYNSVLATCGSRSLHNHFKTLSSACFYGHYAQVPGMFGA